MPARRITDSVRRELWWSAGPRCAFPDCQRLLFESGKTDDKIYVGHECHIVAQKDNPRVARAPCTLTTEEKVRWASLIEDRHGVDNLVLMCQTHSRLIDNPRSGYSVEALVDMKKANEDAVAAERDRELAERFDDAPLADAGVRILVIDDVDEWERASIRELAGTSQVELAWLTAAIGSPSDADRCEALISAWPEELATGSRQLKVAVARAAERHGRWMAAARVWEATAASSGGSVAADMYTRAAIAAGTAGRDGRKEHDRLLDEAERAHSDSLRLRIERIDQDGPVDDLIAELGALTPGPDDGPALVGLLHLQRARAAMLADDLAAAERHFAAAEGVDPESLGTRAMGVNIAIQRARVGVRDDRDFNAGEVQRAGTEALAIRQRLIEMRRFGESARMLMLAADAWATLRDPARARPLLEGALAEELDTDDGPQVLGDSALRCGHADLALRFVANCHDAGAKRIAASARVDLWPTQRVEALDELEQIAAAGGEEALMAAAARLGACLPPVEAPFSEPAAAVLDASQHGRLATGVRVLTLAHAGRHEQAEALLADLPETTWSAELRLRAAVIRGAKSVLSDAAEKVLTLGPDPAGRLLAGKALAQSGSVDRARTEFVTVAQSASAPPAIRSDAYALALRACADRNDWKRAETIFREWSDWASASGAVTDGRISAWQVRIYNHAA